MADQAQESKLPSDEYIEHTYYRLGGALLFKAILRKDCGDGDFECFINSLIEARKAHKWS